MQRDDKPALIALALLLFTILAISTIDSGFRYLATDPPAQERSAGMDQQERENEPPGEVTSQSYQFFGDSAAQWTMAIFTILATIISAIAIKLVNDTLKTSRDATKAAIDANRTARDIGVAQVRAYVSLVDLAGKTDTSKEAIEVSFSMSNTGQTPARKINYRAWLVRIDRNGHRVLTQRSRTVDDPADLIPGERRPIFWERFEFWTAVNLDYSPTTLEAYKAGETEYYIEGWVFYETVLVDHRRETHFRYRVTGWNERQSIPLNFFRTEDGNYST